MTSKKKDKVKHVRPASGGSDSSSENGSAAAGGAAAGGTNGTAAAAGGTKLCCDACDGPHLTEDCPVFKGKVRYHSHTRVQRARVWGTERA